MKIKIKKSIEDHFDLKNLILDKSDLIQESFLHIKKALELNKKIIFWNTKTTTWMTNPQI